MRVKMNKKGDFDFSNYLIGMLLVMGILVSFSALAGELSKTYASAGGANIDKGHFDATYNKIDQIVGVTNQAQNATGNIDFGGSNTFTIQFGSVLTVFKTIFNSITLPISMVGDVITDLSIPYPWNVIIPAILVVLFFSTVIYLIFNRKYVR